MSNEVEELKKLTGNPPQDFTVYQNVSSNGDGTGVTNLVGAAPASYTVTPSSTEKYTLRRMNVLQVDANFNSALGYGAASALTNGITITVEDGSGIIKNYTPLPIKTTYEWGLLAGIDASSTGGVGADANLVRWTFERGGGKIVLDGSKGEFLKIAFGDAMDFMNTVRIQVQGYKENV